LFRASLGFIEENKNRNLASPLEAVQGPAVGPWADEGFARKLEDSKPFVKQSFCFLI
jgi:hypothetical protein